MEYGIPTETVGTSTRSSAVVFGEECPTLPSWTLHRPFTSADHAERGVRHSHGDRGNEYPILRVVFGEECPTFSEYPPLLASRVDASFVLLF